MNKKLTIGEASKLLGYSVDTLRRWDESGRLKAQRETKGGYRYYRLSKLELFSKSLSRFKVAKKWARSKEEFKPLPCYHCSDSFVFQSRLSRMERELNKGEESSDFLSLITAVVGEIGNNSFDHNIGNWPDIPGAFFSFNLDKKRIVLADRGQGILKTLKRVRPDLSNHMEALRTAFTEVVSGRHPEHRGNGLKFVRNAVSGTKMNLVFQTGKAELFLDKGQEVEINSLKSKVLGCLACIEF